MKKRLKLMLAVLLALVLLSVSLFGCSPKAAAVDCVPDGDGWLWEEPNGDNWSRVTPLEENWYLYEMHF